MKRNIIIYACLSFFFGAISISCDKETMPQDTAIEISTNTRGIPADHQCVLYIFKNNSFMESFVLSEGRGTIKLERDDLSSGNSYRFLYISQPAAMTNGVTVKNNAGTALAEGDQWTNLRVEAQSQDMSGQIYYQVSLYAGSALANLTSLEPELFLLVGRHVIDVFKVQNSNINNPVGINSLGTVLNRIDKIDLTYDGFVKTISFGLDNSIIPVSYWPSPFVKTLDLSVEENDIPRFLFVELPQTDIEQFSFSSNEIPGAVRILGAWGFPSNQITVKSKFSYYHTTPLLCPDPDPATHTHDKACFPYKDGDGGSNSAIILNLPQQYGTPLEIRSNVYTVSRAGLIFDRIIDVNFEGGFLFDTQWTNG